jgi:hypothetical protein
VTRGLPLWRSSAVVAAATPPALCTSVVSASDIAILKRALHPHSCTPATASCDERPAHTSVGASATSMSGLYSSTQKRYSAVHASSTTSARDRWFRSAATDTATASSAT